jgi:hypothetical protein
MRRMVALCGLIALLGLVFAWELATPEDNAAPVDAAASASPSRVTRTGANKASPHEFGAEALADIATSTTERPLFSPTRRPSNRSASSAESATAREEVPRLTGVIVGPSGGWAIFAGADGKSHAAATGDAVGGFRVRAIGPGVVTLSGSEGDRVLRPTYVNPPGVTSSEIPTPDVTSLPGVRGNRNREGSR